MTAEPIDQSTEFAAIVSEYTKGSDRALLHAKVQRFAQNLPPETLAALAAPFGEEPEIIVAVYEQIVDAHPDNVRALVVLANAYWLQGRGPQVVGELASRAIAADATNRGAWHLWALSESDPRMRTHRWEQVAERFPDDILALAAMADNAAAVAGAERDYQMLDVAIATYERLRDRSTQQAQREAVDGALRALREWRF